LRQLGVPLFEEGVGDAVDVFDLATDVVGGADAAVVFALERGVAFFEFGDAGVLGGVGDGEELGQRALELLLGFGLFIASVFDLVDELLALGVAEAFLDGDAGAGAAG
jgi:hypothetical protein